MYFNKTHGLYTKRCHFDIKHAELPILLHLTFLFNIIALVTLSKIKRTGDSVDFILVRVLCGNDTVSTILYMCMWLADWISCGALLGSAACPIIGFLATVTVSWSAGIVIVMSACRYLAMVKPFYYRTKITTRKIIYGLVGTLLFCCGYSMFPVLRLAEPYHYYFHNRVCAYNFAPGAGGSVSHRVLLCSMSVVGIGTILFVLFFNVSLIRTLRRNQVGQTPNIGDDTLNVGHNIQQKRSRFAKVTIVVSFVYCLTYGPFLLRIMYDVIYNTAHQNQLRHSVTMCLLFINPVLNPVIYILFNKRYRMCLVAIFKSVFSCNMCQSCSGGANDEQTVADVLNIRARTVTTRF